MIEQILHFEAAIYNARIAAAGDDPVPFYIAHTPPKWNGDIECVTLCRAAKADLDALNAAQLGNYTDGLEPGAQEIIDRCYDRTPVELLDDNGDPYVPPQFFTPPEEIGVFAK